MPFDLFFFISFGINKQNILSKVTIFEFLEYERLQNICILNIIAATIISSSMKCLGLPQSGLFELMNMKQIYTMRYPNSHW